MDAFALRLSTGDYEFLRHIDYDSQRITDVARLGPGAAYYLSLVYRSLHLDEPARRLAAFEAKRGEEIWDRRAAEWLASELLEGKSYAEAFDMTRRFRRRFPDAEEILRPYGESLYRLDRFEDLLEFIGERHGAEGGDLKYADLNGVDDEVVLWWLVARQRLSRGNWQRDFVRFFETRDASEAHSRLGLYVSYRDEVSAHFTPADLLLFLGKQLLADGDYPAAYTSLQSYLKGGGGVSPALARDMNRAALGAGRLTEGAELLVELADPPVSSHREDLLFEAGRLYRWAGSYARAAAMFAEVLSLSGDNPDERTRWYYLSSLVRSNPVSAATEVALASRDFADSTYYADLFEELVSALAEKKMWDRLWLLHEAVQNHVDAGMISQLRVLLARLVQGGHITLSPERRESVARKLLQGAATQSEDRFYRLLAQIILGEEVQLLADSSSIETSASESDEFGEFVLRHFDYGLVEEAYREAQINAERLHTASLLRVGDRLADKGRIDEALRIHALAYRRSDGTLDDSAARRLYPRGYPNTVRTAAELYGLAPAVLFALIREESYFNPEAVSSAGAVGLVQMMPETATDVAGRMRLADDPDLTNAVTSINLGAYYLSHLVQRFDPLSRALAAYNAGQGRVRRWVRDRGALDSVLFLESLPFAETRAYVRKVLVSAAHYGYLYEQTSPTAMVREFFPEL
jgi:soluble lytic murein transglycosylase